MDKYHLLIGMFTLIVLAILFALIALSALPVPIALNPWIIVTIILTTLIVLIV